MRRPGLLALVLLLASCASLRAAPKPEIAITIDDLPKHAPYPPGRTPDQVSSQMIAALRAARVPGVYGMVNAINAQPGTDPTLQRWRDAGFVLGNHTWSHRHLSEMSAAEFEDEVTKDEPVLARLGGESDWRWFRYPFLDEGKDPQQRAAARQILAKHGYHVAAVTTGFSDWQFTEPYARCTATGDKSAERELERLYLDSVRESIAVTRETAHRLYGRDIPYVLLMHVSAMSARMMPQVIQTYREAGFRFVSVAEAERDPVYRGYTDLSLAPPPSTAELAARKGVELPSAKDYSARLAAICR